MYVEELEPGRLAPASKTMDLNIPNLGSPLPPYLAFKEIWRNKGRFLLVSLVIALITTLVLFIAGLSEGLGAGNIEYLEKLNAEVILFQENANLSISASQLERGRLNDIRRVPGVKDAGLIGFSSVSLSLEGEPTSIDVSLFGVEPDGPGEPPAYVGRELRSSRGKEAIIDRNVALRTGLGIGDRFTIKSIQGTEEEYYTLEVAGVSDGRQYFVQPSVFVPYLTWDEIRPRGRVENGEQEGFIFNVIAVQLEDPADIQPMRQRLESRASDIEAVDRKTAYQATPGYSAQQSTLSTIRIFTLLIGVLVIGGFFQIQTLQKVGQIGMLKAIGASTITISLAFMIQIVYITLLGVAIGSIGTLALSLLFPVAVPIVFSAETVALAVISLLIIGPLGGLVSLLVLLRVEPLTALGLRS